MARKPVYGKVVMERDFVTKDEAEEFAKEYKETNEPSGLSFRYDIAMDPITSNWTVTIYQKVS